MSKFLLTVVVPSYNIEKYIEKNIKSFDVISNELKPLFEVLIINDGSTDSTLEVVSECIENSTDLNIRVVNKTNGGHGSAVNRGIEESQGKYFKIIDGDDWVQQSDFEVFLGRLRDTDIDMIVTNYSEQHVYENRKVLKEVLQVEDNYESNVLPGIFPMHSITYRTSILKDNNIRLTEKIFYVDTQYTVFPLKYISNWVYWNLDVYQYFLGRPDQSMSLTNRMKNIDHHRIVLESILEFHKSLVEKTDLEKIALELIKSILNDRYLMSFLSDDRENLLEQTTRYIRQYNIKYDFRMRRKFGWLVYFNEKHGRRYSFIVYPIINLKLKQMNNYGL